MHKQSPGPLPLGLQESKLYARKRNGYERRPEKGWGGHRNHKILLV